MGGCHGTCSGGGDGRNGACRKRAVQENLPTRRVAPPAGEAPAAAQKAWPRQGAGDGKDTPPVDLVLRRDDNGRVHSVHTPRQEARGAPAAGGTPQPRPQANHSDSNATSSPSTAGNAGADCDTNPSGVGGGAGHPPPASNGGEFAAVVPCEPPAGVRRAVVKVSPLPLSAIARSPSPASSDEDGTSPRAGGGCGADAGLNSTRGFLTTRMDITDMSSPGRTTGWKDECRQPDDGTRKRSRRHFEECDSDDSASQDSAEGSTRRRSGSLGVHTAADASEDDRQRQKRRRTAEPGAAVLSPGFMKAVEAHLGAVKQQQAAVRARLAASEPLSSRGDEQKPLEAVAPVPVTYVLAKPSAGEPLGLLVDGRLVAGVKDESLARAAGVEKGVIISEVNGEVVDVQKTQRASEALAAAEGDVHVLAHRVGPRDFVQAMTASQLSAARSLYLARKVLSTFAYTTEGATFNVEKKRSLAEIYATASQILRDGVRIQCVEGTFVGLLLTDSLPSVIRFGLSFESKTPTGMTYKHLVLGVRLCRRYGALGISRNKGLMTKPMRFSSLAELVADFVLHYGEDQHVVTKLLVSRPVNRVESVKPEWRAGKFDVTPSNWAALEKRLKVFESTWLTTDPGDGSWSARNPPGRSPRTARGQKPGISPRAARSKTPAPSSPPSPTSARYQRSHSKPLPQPQPRLPAAEVWV
ncbi:hypothetical protein DIPPA_24191 [Diplonema papillatum]|nr:hypothetical protein DIPPA_24191 [Diplonema papillatum]